MSKMHSTSLADAQLDMFNIRIQRAMQSQIEYAKLFSKLDVILTQMKDKFPAEFDSNAQEETMSNSTTSGDHFYSVSDVGSVESKCSPRQRKRTFAQMDADDGIGFETDEDAKFDGNRSYPHYKLQPGSAPTVVIGPGGTQIAAALFDAISWQSGPIATRSLLGYVFSAEVLATHTLTGKPSPAFRGDRERPSKMQLDVRKVADISYCVQKKCNSNEREIRAVITTKCADSAKKTKRRLLKINAGK